MIRNVLRRTFGALLKRRGRRALGELLAHARDVARWQEHVLLEKIHRNACSDFGRDFGLAHIRSVKDFQARMPITQYQDYDSYIERVKQGQLQAMFGPGQRVHMLAMTSGTTATPKFIPVTDPFLEEYRRGWLIWGIKAFTDHPQAMFRHIVQVVSSAEELHTPAGIPCGSISGLIAHMQKPLVRGLYCVPSCTGAIKDVRAKHYTAVRLSVPHPVGFMTSANPSTLVQLAKTGNAYAESLIRDVADGTLSETFDIPRAVRDALQRRISKKRKRLSRRLERILADRGHLYPVDYWPSLRLLGNWKAGAVGRYLRLYPEYYGDTPVRDIGLLASEGRMTIPLSDDGSAGVLDVDSHFFEFVPEAEVDAAHPTVLLCHEAEVGQNYFVLLTTSSGFYRYNIYDLVRVVDRCGQTPVVEFLNKGAYIASVTGEKLSERQVVQAVDQVVDQHGLPVQTYMMAPCWADPPYYALILEQDAVGPQSDARAWVAEIDAALCRLNLEYRSKRESRRLGPVRVKLVPTGTWEAFDRQRLHRTGGSAEQYKHPCLATETDFAAQFEVVGEVEGSAGGASGGAKLVQ